MNPNESANNDSVANLYMAKFKSAEFGARPMRYPAMLITLTAGLLTGQVIFVLNLLTR